MATRRLYQHVAASGETDAVAARAGVLSGSTHGVIQRTLIAWRPEL